MIKFELSPLWMFITVVVVVANLTEDKTIQLSKVCKTFQQTTTIIELALDVHYTHALDKIHILLSECLFKLKFQQHISVNYSFNAF